MKTVLFSLLILVLGMLGVGFYIKSTGDSNGEIIIGIAVLIIAFVLMPLFIYDGYKKKRLKDFNLNELNDRIKENLKKD